jgi:glycosyltransferase involved in cell wall biosynthesis
MKSTCTCIIPFYNEEKRIWNVLEKLIQISYFDHIILVNDWSTDKGKNIIEKFIDEHRSHSISLISYQENKGKSHAVYEGLQKVDTDYVFLFDADLTNIKIHEIITLIENMYNHPKIDMGILRRIYAKRYIKLLYRELILSGQRMMRTADLLQVFKEKFDRYQLEVAINTYMYNHKKTTVRFPFSAENSFKADKWWFWNGWRRDFFMYKDIIGYQWFFKFIKHVFLFSPYNIKTYLKKYHR